LSTVLWGCATSCVPFAALRYPSFGDTMRCACRFAPVGPRHQTAGQGCVIRSPLPDMDAWRRSGPPKFLGNPHVSTPCSQTPAESVASSHNNAPTRPPLFKRRRLPATKYISGLNGTASTRAVYASPAASLQRTQDSLPAVGQTLRDGIGYPQGSYERFP
jgi:hypothetical protein